MGTAGSSPGAGSRVGSTPRREAHRSPTSALAPLHSRPRNGDTSSLSTSSTAYGDLGHLTGVSNSQCPSPPRAIHYANARKHVALGPAQGPVCPQGCHQESCSQVFLSRVHLPSIYLWKKF